MSGRTCTSPARRGVGASPGGRRALLGFNIQGGALLKSAQTRPVLDNTTCARFDFIFKYEVLQKKPVLTLVRVEVPPHACCKQQGPRSTQARRESVAPQLPFTAPAAQAAAAHARSAGHDSEPRQLPARMCSVRRGKASAPRCDARARWDRFQQEQASSVHPVTREEEAAAARRGRTVAAC